MGHSNNDKLFIHTVKVIKEVMFTGIVSVPVSCNLQFMGERQMGLGVYTVIIVWCYSAESWYILCFNKSFQSNETETNKEAPSHV